VVVRIESAVRTAVVVTDRTFLVVVVKMLGDCKRGRGFREKKEKGKGEEEGELPNYPSSSQQNYYFAHGVIFVSKIICLLNISHIILIP